MPFTFLNADLEVTSGEPLSELKDALIQSRHEVLDLFCGSTSTDVYFAGFEIHPKAGGHDADTLINAFCEVIESLKGAAKANWTKASKRVIDLGYQADNHCSAWTDHLSLTTLRRMTQNAIELGLTLYPQTIKND